MTDQSTRWRRPLSYGLAGVLAAGTIGFAVAAPGQSVSEVPPESTSIWVLNRDGGQYAQVNMAIDELGTPQSVENPNNIAQYGDETIVFGSQYAKAAHITLSTPQDLSDGQSSDGFSDTPDGTQSVAIHGDSLAYVTAEGVVYTGQISSGGQGIPVAFDDEEKSDFLPTAIAFSPDGDVVAYSPSSGEIRQISHDDGSVSTIAEGVEVAEGDALPQLAMAGQNWVVLDATSSSVQSANCPGVSLDTQDGARIKLQSSPSTTDAAYVADSSGLSIVDLADCRVSSHVDIDGSNTPAAPYALDGTMYAAWESDAGDSGAVWSEKDNEVTALDFSDPTVIVHDSPVPTLMSNGRQMVVNDISTGLVWNLDGSLVKSSAQWDIDRVDAVSIDDQQEQKVTEPKSPIAEADSFGVRAGREIVLPVLLNDHDPNEDVLTVVSQLLDGLPGSFGTVRVGTNSQQIIIDVSDTATGSASFTYQISDGTSAADSTPATVTVEVKAESENNAPEWCGDGIVTGCLEEWPSLAVSAGSSAQVDALRGWVDPEGDPIFLSSVTDTNDSGVTVFDPQGIVTYKNNSDSEATSTGLSVVAADSLGAESTAKQLAVTVSEESDLAFSGTTATGIVGKPVAVDLTNAVTGAVGDASITTVAADNQDATSTTVSGSLGLSFSATAAGSYPVKVTVSDDTGTEVTGTVRFTVTKPEDAVITAVPLTAFVRENEDTTIDVFSAVGNPSELALIVDDLQPTVADGASLTANVVGGQNIRFSGSKLSGTSIDGATAPFSLGSATYRVSDGTDAVSARGQITFILLPAADATPPVAVDDTVTVRAGDQVDISVLDNDVAPAGATIQLNAATVSVDQDDWNENGGLAFGTDRQVRVLAPTAPGEYSIRYTIFRLGFPTATSTATVKVTVIGTDANLAPTPVTLTGRVVAGGTTTIALVQAGSDPDGDSISLDKILTQPAKGTASISEDGSSIVYTAKPGEENIGQDTFTYQVKDFLGEKGSGTATIGIRAQTDVSPVTYTDYVQVQASASDGDTSSAAVVFPLKNDVDPQGLVLTLTDVEPLAVETLSDGSQNPEYARLKGLLNPVPDTDSGEVSLVAGTELGTFSYRYSVENEEGDTATGLIIVKVVNDPVPDYPIVQDTRLTTETREFLSDGVDVLSGKVSWSTGDVNRLTLGLAGHSSGFSVSGWDISGEASANAQIIPFTVTGTPFVTADSAFEVTTYGFLRIPGKNDVVLSLREDTRLTVDEGQSATLDLDSAIISPSGEDLIIGDVTVGGARSEATCSVSGSTLTYAAGEGEPWVDSCVVSVRVSSFDEGEFAQLSVPVTVVPEDPSPGLRSGARTISPGETQTIDLLSLVTWEKHTADDIAQLSVSVAGTGGTSFEITPVSGNQLSIRGLDDAVPGTQISLTISISEYSDTPASTIVLTVGPAPSELPRGATVTQQCGQADGDGCSITVIGAAGEFNPLPGTALTLVSVSSPANCPGITFSKQSSTDVAVTWTADAAGYKSCTGTFVVEDAQGRVSSGDRAGQIILDFRALPSSPTNVEWTAYTKDSVTLRATSSESYPAITGYVVTMDDGGTVGTCDAAGVCTVTGLTNGDKHTFEVKATNAQGSSRTGTSVTAWSYEAPSAPSSGTAKPLLNGGEATLSISGIDSTTSSLSIVLVGTGVSATATPSNGTAVVTIAVPSPAQNYSAVITPVTRFDVPPIPGGSSEGKTLTINGIYTVAQPTLSQVVVDPQVNNRTISASVSLVGQPLGQGAVRAQFGFALNGATCTPTSSESSMVFENVNRNAQYTVTACAWYTFEDQQTAKSETVSAPTALNISGLSQSPYYQFGSGYSRDGSTYTWSDGPSVTLPAVDSEYEVWYSSASGRSTDLGSFFSPGVDPGAIVAYVCEPGGSVCSADATPVNSANGLTYAPRIVFPRDPSLTVSFVDDGKLAAGKAAIQQYIRSSVLVSAPEIGSVDIVDAALRADESGYDLTVSFPEAWGLSTDGISIFVPVTWQDNTPAVEPSTPTDNPTTPPEPDEGD